MFGIKTEGEEFFEIVFTVIEKLPQTQVPTFILGVLLVLLLVALARWAPRIPGALAVCAVAIVATFLFDLGSYGIALVGAVPSGVPSLTIPGVRWADLAALVPAAVAIAFLAFSDGILLAQTFAEKNGYEVRPNRELVALGSANILAGLWQGFPVSASQSRTSIVDSAGGRTQVAQLILAIGLLLFLFFLTGLIALLPKVALGAILIVTAIGMLELASLRGLYRVDRVEFGIAMGVTLAILIAGVVPGIILGLLLSLISVLVEISRPDDAVLRRRLIDGKFHDCRDDEEGVESVPGLLVYRLYAPLMFANARHVMNRIRTLVDAADAPVRWLVIDAQAIHDMDVTAAQRFAELHRELADEGVDVKIADAPRPFLEELAKVGLSEEIGKMDFFVSVRKASPRSRNSTGEQARRQGGTESPRGDPAAAGAPRELRSTSCRCASACAQPVSPAAAGCPARRVLPDCGPAAPRAAGRRRCGSSARWFASRRRRR
jgi:SulP family sulfate permease